MAVDPAGNVSPEAKVSIQIEKPDTKVTYADMEGNPAHKASIRLAEEGIFVGSYVNGSYFFDPDQPGQPGGISDHGHGGHRPGTPGGRDPHRLL